MWRKKVPGGENDKHKGSEEEVCLVCSRKPARRYMADTEWARRNERKSDRKGGAGLGRVLWAIVRTSAVSLSELGNIAGFWTGENILKSSPWLLAGGSQWNFSSPHFFCLWGWGCLIHPLLVVDTTLLTWCYNRLDLLGRKAPGHYYCWGGVRITASGNSMLIITTCLAS